MMGDEPAVNERDELLARAVVLGVKVDGRWGLDRLRDTVTAATVTASDGTVEVRPEPQPATVTVSQSWPADDGWPKRIAPCVWLDQRGRRYTDLGAAMVGADECRS